MLIIIFFKLKVTDSSRHTPSPVSSNPSLNLSATMAALQQLPLGQLFLQNQLGYNGLPGLSPQDLNAFQQALQAQQATLQQQLHNYVLIHGGGNLPSGQGTANAQAQATAQLLMQNRVSC